AQLAGPKRDPEDDEDDDEDDEDGPASSKDSRQLAGSVAVVEIRGLLSSEVSEWACGWSDGYHGQGGIVDRIAAALAAPDVAAVVVDVDPPGGDAWGWGEAAAQIARLRMESTKPVLVYARQACSAAYWLATAAAGDGGLYVSESSDIANVGCYAV